MSRKIRPTPLPEPAPKRFERDSEAAEGELWMGLLKASFRVERERMQLNRLLYQAASSNAASTSPVLQFSKVLLEYVVKMLRDEAGEKATAADAAQPSGARQSLGASR